jgi:hypothetical protein
MMRSTRVLPIFSILFPILYEPTMYFNWPVFTYVPQQAVFHAWRYMPSKAEGPPMFYFGWLITAGVAAALLTLAWTYAPQRVTQRVPANLAWIAPVVVVFMLLDILSPWFTHS